MALPLAGFQLLGAYDDWAGVMTDRAAPPREGSLITIARKAGVKPLTTQ